MAFYAALVSLLRVINQIQHHPRPPISVDKKQAEDLTEKVTFLQDFLESYSHIGNEEADSLQSRIAEAAYAAEDIIESHVVDQILAQSTSTTHGENIGSNDFHPGLSKVIEDMDFIKKEVMEIEEKMGVEDQQHRNSTPDVSLRSPSAGQNTIVSLDDVSLQLMEKLTGQQADRQIIPIVGMSGIGKTTLARNVYEKSLIVQHFDRRAWVTISQEYSMRKILVELLCQISQEKRETLSEKSENYIGVKLHKSLSGRRYLIVIDDIWSIEAWDGVKFFFPDNSNGSRILLNTRLSNMALHISGIGGLEMNFLDEDKSWHLFCKIIFGEKGCPLEFEEIGKDIAKNCKGLPLSIAVVGGLLAKSKWPRGYWKYIAQNLNSIVNLEDDERCSKILHMSYNQLPVYLKPCFLYMGAYPEDIEIRVSQVIKQWVAEGFLKPVNDKSLEEIAEEYLKDLIDRNLILVHKWGINGKIKSFKVHDLLRDLCVREAEKENFLCVRRIHSLNIPQGVNTPHRIAIHESKSKEEYLPQVLNALQSMPLARSLICNCWGVLPSQNSRLLRVLRTVETLYIDENCFQNLRHFEIIDVVRFLYPTFLSSACRLWNLHTIIVKNQWHGVIAPLEIWKMPQLRHVEFSELYLPDPPSGVNGYILENLQTLLGIGNLKFSEEVVKKIPNIKKLGIFYNQFAGGSSSHCCLNNLGRLHKLESLACSFLMGEKGSWRDNLQQNLTFPDSLKKLTLQGSQLHWEDMITTKIGSLSLLEVLKLKRNSFIGSKWETVEGQFPSLKFLKIHDCEDLEYWIADSTHFPKLEHLVLRCLKALEEIPSGIGEIPTLQSIELDFCGHSAIISAKKIIEEQAELGNEDLKIRVQIWRNDKEVERLASHNFLVDVWLRD